MLPPNGTTGRGVLALEKLIQVLSTGDKREWKSCALCQQDVPLGGGELVPTPGSKTFQQEWDEEQKQSSFWDSAELKPKGSSSSVSDVGSGILPAPAASAQGSDRPWRS